MAVKSSDLPGLFQSFLNNLGIRVDGIVYPGQQQAARASVIEYPESQQTARASAIPNPVDVAQERRRVIPAATTTPSARGNIHLQIVGRLWMLGDSQVRAFTPQPPHFTCTKFGGHTIAEIERAVGDSRGWVPSHVRKIAIFCGSNDVLRNREASLAANDMISLVDAIRSKRYDGQLILLLIPVPGHKARRLNESIMNDVRDGRYGDRVTTIDTFTVLTETGGNQSLANVFCRDRIHISQYGAECLAGELRRHNFVI